LERLLHARSVCSVQTIFGARRRIAVQRSSQSIASLSAALAKAQAKLVNPDIGKDLPGIGLVPTPV
jgi:hypothetical protein